MPDSGWDLPGISDNIEEGLVGFDSPVNRRYFEKRGIQSREEGRKAQIEDGQAAFGSKPCGSSTNLAAMPSSNWA
jgi:hypothetical protein